jgi:hypothetical protein
MGRRYMFGERYALQYIVYIVRENCVKYGIACPLKIIKRILLKPPKGIASLNQTAVFSST